MGSVAYTSDDRKELARDVNKMALLGSIGRLLQG